MVFIVSNPISDQVLSQWRHLICFHNAHFLLNISFNVVIYVEITGNSITSDD